MPKNSENDHIMVFALLTRKKVVMKQFLKLADISGAPGMNPAPQPKSLGTPGVWGSKNGPEMIKIRITEKIKKMKEIEK